MRTHRTSRLLGAIVGVRLAARFGAPLRAVLDMTLAAALGACLMVCFAAIATAQAQQEGGKRVALVVGNGGYRAVPGLDNPPNDARLLARTLRAKGFTLVGGDARIELDRSHF